MSFLLTVLFLCFTYAICGIAARWLSAKLGIDSIAHGVIIGTSAYTYALCGRANISTGGCIISALLIGSFTGWLVILLSERVTGEDFALASFGVQVLWLVTVKNWDSVTGGVLGVPGIRSIPAPWVSNFPLSHAIVALTILLFSGYILHRIDLSAFSGGVALLKRSKELAFTFGVPSLTVRSQVGLAYGLCLSATGVLLASFLTFISPDQFGTNISVSVLAISFLVISGQRRIGSGILGAFWVVGAPQLLRLIGLSSTRVGFAQLFLSGMLVACSPFIAAASGKAKPQ